jgi:transposase
MDFQKIIIELLGIQDVIIEDIKRFKKDLRIEIKIRQKREECYCSKCGLQFSGVKEWVLKDIKAPPLGVYQDVTLKFWQMRGYCEDCQRTSVAKATWLHPRFEGMTCGFAEVAGRLMEEITCEAVSRILKSDSKLMWNLDQYRMEVMLQFLRLPKDIDVSYLCADEVHFRSIKNKNRKGLFAKRYAPKFVTNLVCPAEGKVLFNAMGRDSAALTTAMTVLSPGQKLAVEKFAVDMHDPFILAIKQQCPNAQVVIDRFHLAQKINEAFDKVRKLEFKKARAKKDHFQEGMLEPHRRFILMARDADLSKSEGKLIDKLRFANKEINCAMLMVEYFHKALDQKTVKDFRKVLGRWYQLCRNTRYEPFLKFAKLMRKYRKNVEGYITSRLTTAVIEGLNNKIKVLRRMGYGYTNETSFMRKILQRCGYLNHLSINTDEFFFKWPNPA